MEPRFNNISKPYSFFKTLVPQTTGCSLQKKIKDIFLKKISEKGDHWGNKLASSSLLGAGGIATGLASGPLVIGSVVLLGTGAVVCKTGSYFLKNQNRTEEKIDGHFKTLQKYGYSNSVMKNAIEKPSFSMFKDVAKKLFNFFTNTVSSNEQAIEKESGKELIDLWKECKNAENWEEKEKKKGELLEKVSSEKKRLNEELKEQINDPESEKKRLNTQKQHTELSDIETELQSWNVKPLKDRFNDACQQAFEVIKSMKSTAKSLMDRTIQSFQDKS